MVGPIKIWTDLPSVLSQCTRLTDGQTDRQTDGHTEFSSPCSALKQQSVNSGYGGDVDGGEGDSNAACGPGGK